MVDFIEMATRTDYLEMQIEEVQLQSASELVGKTLGERRFQQDLGVIVVAIKTPSGEMTANPTGDTVLKADSTLIVACLVLRSQ